MDDLEFTNIEAALNEYGNRVAEMYRQKLIDDDKVASSRLINTVSANVVLEDTQFVVTLNLTDYAKYVEEGISPAGKYGNPGWKAYPFILDWIHIKPSFQGQYKLPGEKGNLPTDKTLAFLITRKIKEKGIDPGLQLASTLEELNAQFIPIFQEAIEKDFYSYAGRLVRDALSHIRI